MNKMHETTKEYLLSNIPDFSSGDSVSVKVRVTEGSKERIQKFDGVVISRKGGKGLDASFTVRKITNGVGVERIFPLHSPLLSSIEVNIFEHFQLQILKLKLFFQLRYLGLKYYIN